MVPILYAVDPKVTRKKMGVMVNQGTNQLHHNTRTQNRFAYVNFEHHAGVEPAHLTPY